MKTPLFVRWLRIRKLSTDIVAAISLAVAKVKTKVVGVLRPVLFLTLLAIAALPLAVLALLMPDADKND